MTYILEMDRIQKSFSGVPVLDQVSLKVRAGEVHALMGENGAGKSTLMKILMGIYKKDGGTMVFNGAGFQPAGPKEAIAAGISMIHQELNPVLDLDVAENVFLGRELRVRGVPGLRPVDKAAMRKETEALFSAMGISMNAGRLMRHLSVAEMQLVEIVKAISLKAGVIIMDEPTSALTEHEAEVLFRQIARLKDHGVAVIYISHKMEEIFRISDTITVLRDGRPAGSAPAAELSRDKLISMMVGREITEIYPKSQTRKGDMLLEVRDLCRGRRVRNINLTLRRGEVLGIAGLVGAGRSELAETLFGIFPARSGQILIEGRPVRIRHPKEAIARGMALITEDRKQTGLNLKTTVEQNISIVSIRKLAPGGVIRKKKEAEAAERYIGTLRIKTRSRKTPVVSLSGGNQQKVVLAKWLLSDPEIIIFDEPTRGIDVGAKRDIYLLIGRLAEAGKGVVVISSEMPEVMGISDRIMVMCEGRCTGELNREDFSQEKIMDLASAPSEPEPDRGRRERAGAGGKTSGAVTAEIKEKAAGGAAE